MAELDLEIKDEFQGKAIRQKCWPMPEADVLENEKPVQELVDAGLVEPFPVGSFPKHCSPTFLVEKKESKTRSVRQIEQDDQAPRWLFAKHGGAG